MRKVKISGIISSALVFALVLATLTFAASAESSGDFSYTVLEDGTAKITGYTGPGGDVEIPSEINGCIVTGIGNAAFVRCESLTSVTIPDSVTSIGNSAFSGCTSLTSVTIPVSVTSIGDLPFSICTLLTAINVAEENENYCSVDGVLFSKDVTSLIAYPAGKEQSSFDVPQSVTDIECYAFYYCKNLTAVTIPESVTSIEGYAFSGCTSLTAIDVDEKNENYCSVAGVVFDKNVEELIAYPIGNEQTVYLVADGVTSIGGGAFEGCKNLEDVTLPASMTSIGDDAFYSCKNLVSVTLSEGLTSIGDSAFFACPGLTSITIPASVTVIGANAFTHCTSLELATFLCDDVDISENVFKDCAENLTIRAAAGSSAAEYANANGLTFKDSALAPGDVNSDGKVDSADATLVLQFYAEIIGENTEGYNNSAADLNGDGAVNAADATIILQMYAGIIN